MDQHYDDSIEDDKRRLQMWLVGSIIGLLLLAVAGWFARIPYRHFMEKHDAAQAKALLASGDYRDAVLNARQALELDPTNIPACQVLATVADFSHLPITLDLLRRIALAEPTLDNKLRLAEAGLRYQNPPYPLSAQILDELAVVGANVASYQVVAARMAVCTRHLTDAQSHFEAAAELEPTNQLFKLNLATIRLAQPNHPQAGSARAVLQQMRQDTNFAAAALRSLVADRLAQKDLLAANDYSAQLLANPQAEMADRLQQLEILQQLKSGDFATRLEAVQKISVTNASAVAQVASWMRANGLLAASIPWLTNLPASLRSQSQVRLALAEGYLQSTDWRTLREFAGHGNWDDIEFLRLAILSRAWSQLDMKPVADSNWSSAVNEAENQYGALITLLELAEQWNLPREQADLLEKIVAKFPKEHWAQQDLAQSYFNDGKTVELYQLYIRLLSLFPKDQGAKNNLAATALLLKTNLTQAGHWAAEAYAARTNDPSFASTYAFALHLQGRTKDGLAILQKLDEHLRQRPDAALYYGVLLAQTGATNEAGPYLQIARTQGHLLPEEQQLLTAAMGN